MFSKRLWSSASLYSKGSGTLSSEGYADHSSLSSAAVKREWSNTSTSPTPSQRGEGQHYLLQSLVRPRIVDARTWKVEGTTASDKHSADLKSGRYIYVYWIHTCMESNLRVLLTNIAIVRNFKTTYGETNLAQDDGVLTQYSQGQEHVQEFCPETWWWCETLTFRRRIKSRLPFAGIIRRLPYSTRFQDKG